MSFGQPGDSARHTGGEVSRHARLLSSRAIHVATGPTWRGLSVVQGLHSTVPRPDDHEATPTDIPRLGVDHRQCESDCDRRIYRIAALPQDVPPHLAG
jgi:hypothetical protein